MNQLIPAFSGLASLLEQAIHDADRAVIVPFIEQSGINSSWRAILEAFFVQMSQDHFAFSWAGMANFFGVQMKTALELSLTLVLAMVFVGLFGGQSTGRTEQRSTPNAKETKAEEDIAKVSEALRQQKGLPKLRRIHDPRLREDACESAKRGRGTGSLYFPGTTNVMTPSGMFGDVGNLSTFSFTTAYPNQFSPELQIWATQRTYYSEAPHRFGVGVCFVSTTEHPEGTYWIDIGYYMGEIKAFLYRVTFMWE
jgi:hypothetical protein